MADQVVIAQRSPYVMEVGPAMVYWCRVDGQRHNHSATAPIRARSFPRSKWRSRSDSGSHFVAASTRRSHRFATGLIHVSKLSVKR